jgi:hypothetical protein
MSDAHFTFSTTEITVFLLFLLTPPAVLAGALTCATRWIFETSWLYSAVIGVGNVLLLLAVIYGIAKLRG